MLGATELDEIEDFREEVVQSGAVGIAGAQRSAYPLPQAECPLERGPSAVAERGYWHDLRCQFSGLLGGRGGRGGRGGGNGRSSGRVRWWPRK